MNQSSLPDQRSVPGWKRYVNSLIACELSTLTRYYDRLVQWLPRPEDSGVLFDAIDCPEKVRLHEGEEVPDLTAEKDRRTAILINGAFNHDRDLQGRLQDLKSKLSRTSRVLLVLYNPYLRWLYSLANRFGIRRGELPGTFLTRVSLETLARLSGYEVVRQRNSVYCPFRLFGTGSLINKLLPVIPLFRWLSLTEVAVLRPVIPETAAGLSCVIPARNEKGNIEDALRRFPRLPCEVEIIFVEGDSTDGTWEEIQRVAAAYDGPLRVKALQQRGMGKADAVRLGFGEATGPLLTILDADLTMPPEMLGRYYDAYCQGYGDFVNGSRLVYPMEGEAMRFMNRLGNVFFSKALSWTLGTSLSDTLCGTKLLTKHDYARMIAWRKDFGDFDPFGDFELLFPAATLGLGIVDMPVAYRARTYGDTNIRRFGHGFELLKMTLIGFWRIRLAPVRRRKGEK